MHRHQVFRGWSLRLSDQRKSSRRLTLFLKLCWAVSLNLLKVIKRKPKKHLASWGQLFLSPKKICDVLMLRLLPDQRRVGASFRCQRLDSLSLLMNTFPTLEDGWQVDLAVVWRRSIVLGQAKLGLVFQALYFGLRRDWHGDDTCFYECGDAFALR